MCVKNDRGHSVKKILFLVKKTFDVFLDLR